MARGRVPVGSGHRAADVRDATEHPATGDRQWRGVRGAVRARLDGRRIRGDRPALRRGAAGGGCRGVALVAAV